MAGTQPPPPPGAENAPAPSQPDNNNNHNNHGGKGNGNNNDAPPAAAPAPVPGSAPALPLPQSPPLAATSPPESNNNNGNNIPLLSTLPIVGAPRAPQPASPTSDNTIPLFPSVPSSAPASLPPPPPLQQQQPLIPQTNPIAPVTTTVQSFTRKHHSRPSTTGLAEPSETPYYWPENPDNEPDANAGIMLTVSLVVIFLVLACMGLVVFCLFRRRSAKRRMHLFSKSSSSATLTNGLGDLFVKDNGAGGAGAAAAAALRRESFQSLGRGGGYFGGAPGDGSDISRALQEMSEHHQNALLSRRSNSMSPTLGARGGGSGYWSTSGSATPLTGGVYGAGSVAGGGAGSSSGLLASANSSGLLVHTPQSQGMTRSNSLIIGSGDYVAGPQESTGEFRTSSFDDYYGGTAGSHHAHYLYPGLGGGSSHYNQGGGSGGASVNLSRRSSLSPDIYPHHQSHSNSKQSSPLFRAKTVSVGNGIGQQQYNQNYHPQPYPYTPQHQHPYHPQSFQGASSNGRPMYPMPPAQSSHDAPASDKEEITNTNDGLNAAGGGKEAWAEEIDALDLGSPFMPAPKDRFDDGEELEGRPSSQQNQQQPVRASAVSRSSAYEGGDAHGAGVGRPPSMTTTKNPRPASSSILIIPPSITTRRRSDNNMTNMYSNPQQQQQPRYPSPYQTSQAYYPQQRPQVYPHQQLQQQQSSSQPSYYTDNAYSPNPQESVTEFGPTGSSFSLSTTSVLSTPSSSAPSTQNQQQQQQQEQGIKGDAAAGDVSQSTGEGGQDGGTGPAPSAPADAPVLARRKSTSGPTVLIAPPPPAAPIGTTDPN
ncbi:hypothetical protein EMPS_08809 [Entomortierella parvispora]|uniref:Uncharacterized protein n=1 Tax=Entomortierella parvispora TaxID=205924 RepID=A0A9P3LZZ8_9FUNG|nr:hypothetical protein EMPS_08809 [Entomortierella parvispora]